MQGLLKVKEILDMVEYIAVGRAVIHLRAHVQSIRCWVSVSAPRLMQTVMALRFPRMICHGRFWDAIFAQYGALPLAGYRSGMDEHADECSSGLSSAGGGPGHLLRYEKVNSGLGHV